ncbi:MAG: Holliday junction resolvase RuvX [Eubacterium sp.]|nr:Holliday junction resolvase RuvX [Eubacterium sp.]
MRILGLDFGSKTVGVAVTDALGMTAQGVEIIRRPSPKKMRKTLARIQELVEQYDVEKIVIGYPVMLSGSEGERVEKTKEFAQLVQKRTGKEIVFQDERLTTVEAYEIMDEVGIRKEDRYLYVDQIAATIILEDYMHQQNKE